VRLVRKCGACKKEFKTSYYVDKEYSKKRKNFRCRSCKLKKNKIQREVIAPRKVHNDCVCDICGAVRKGKFAIDIHLDRHRNLKCNVCHAHYKQRTTLKPHLRTHFENFLCSYCGEKFGILKRFKMHMATHDPEKYKKEAQKAKNMPSNFPCRWCGLPFDKMNNRASHEFRIHKNREDDAFKCKVCDKVFRQKEELRMHLFDHYTGKIHFCDFPDCDRFFHKGKLLTVHKRCHFPPQYTCQGCGQQFVQNSGLHKHMRGRCKGPKPVEADLTFEEIDRIALVAKQQFKSLGGRTTDGKNPYETAIAKEQRIKLRRRQKGGYFQDDMVQEESCSSTAEETDDEFDNLPPIEESLDLKQESDVKEEYPHDFLKVEIKMEVDDTFIVNEWKYECLDDADIDDQMLEPPEQLPEFSPVVLLERLDPNIIDAWKLTEALSNREVTISKRKPKPAPKRKIIRSFGGTGRRRGRPRKNMTSSETDFQCDECGGYALSKHDLQKHFLTHNKDVPDKKPEMFECDICGNKYSSRSSIATHVQITHKTVRDIPCSMCDKMFKSNGNLKRHINDFHERNFRLTCHICAKMFRQKYQLDNHLNTHNVPVECPVCHKKVAWLEHHMKIHNSDRKVVLMACPICGRQYNQYLLRYHIDRVHNKVENGNIYRCDKCQQDFPRRDDLRR